MRRVRQEAAEVYEITATEIARALGVLVTPEDEVTIGHRYGELWALRVASVTEESVEIELPGTEDEEEESFSIPLVEVVLPPLGPDVLPAPTLSAEWVVNPTAPAEAVSFD